MPKTTAQLVHLTRFSPPAQAATPPPGEGSPPFTYALCLTYGRRVAVSRTAAAWCWPCVGATRTGNVDDPTAQHMAVQNPGSGQGEQEDTQ